jgi:hypothetical protein
MRHWLPGILVIACPWLLTGQIAVLQIQVVEGEGAVHAAGARNQRPLTAEITDETGRPVAGAAVTFTMPDSGPSGQFANGLGTDVITADAHGRASLRSFRLNHTPGRFQIRITASKEQARAGTVSFQYIAGPQPGRTGAPFAAAPKSNNRKWVLLAVLAGAAIGGIAAGAGGSHGTAAASSSVTTTTVPSAVVVVSTSIGTPTIAAGKP